MNDECDTDRIKSLKTENARLRKAIEGAPHEDFCNSKGWAVPQYHHCNCWKSRALAGSPAAQPTPEDKPARMWRCRCNFRLPLNGTDTADGFLRCVNCKRLWSSGLGGRRVSEDDGKTWVNV